MVLDTMLLRSHHPNWHRTQIVTSSVPIKKIGMYREVFIFNAMKIYYAYILKCSDNTYYTGFTSNLTKRYEEHKMGRYPESYT